MLWAIDENEQKIEPSPGNVGKCPLCKAKVFAKCGEINVWHWAHFISDNCDPWHEPETHWHLNWKMTFGKENTEIPITKDLTSHRADILTKEGVVIELQNSPIQNPIIKKREEFYGDRMIWLINGIHFKDNFLIKDSDIKSLNINRHFPIEEESKSSKSQKYFFWKHAHKSWVNVERHVFVDFGEDTLFCIKEGMGTCEGKGKYYSKESFIKKYGGNYEYYCNQFSNYPDDQKINPTTTISDQ